MKLARIARERERVAFLIHEHEYECAGIEMSRFIHTDKTDKIAESMHIDIFIYLRFVEPIPCA